MDKTNGRQGLTAEYPAQTPFAIAESTPGSQAAHPFERQTSPRESRAPVASTRSDGTRARGRKPAMDRAELPNARVRVDSLVPVFEQIKNLIRFAILGGVYRDGDQIPPVLVLAKQLGVNLNTVAKAYRDLEVSGVITTRRGMGCFVRDGAVRVCRSTLQREIFGRLRESVLEARAAGISEPTLTRFVQETLASGDGPYQA